MTTYEQPSITELPVTTFQIVESSEHVLESWLTRDEVSPTLEQNQEGVYVLSLHNQGEHGKFDLPYIANQIIHADDDLVVILVSYHGTETFGRKKNLHVAKGQFWRYFQRNDDGIWSRIEWRQLTDETRQAVLDTERPDWAKIPGKITTDYAKPTKRVMTTSYKLVRVIEDRYYSVYSPDEEYVLGERKKQPARKNHRGGYYSYPSQERVLELFHGQSLFPYRCYREIMTLALLECEIGGKIIEYSNGKWSSTYLRPLQVISTLEYSPN